MQAFLPEVQSERNRNDEEMVELQSKVGDLYLKHLRHWGVCLSPLALFLAF